MFSSNLPPALLAEWPGSFSCYCGNTGVERIPKADPGEELNSPVAPAETRRTGDLLSTIHAVMSSSGTAYQKREAFGIATRTLFTECDMRQNGVRCSAPSYPRSVSGVYVPTPHTTRTRELLTVIHLFRTDPDVKYVAAQVIDCNVTHAHYIYTDAHVHTHCDDTCACR